MFFQKSDKENIQKILSCTDGNKVQILHLTHEINDMTAIIKRLEIVIDQLANDFETLKSRMIALENKVVPKLASPPKPKTKK